MRVIVLKRPERTGKTPTLIQLYKELVNSYSARDLVEPKECPFSGGDYEYFVSINGLKLAIVTMGDYPTDIMYPIGYYEALGADVIVLPERHNWCYIEENYRRRGNGISDNDIVESCLSGIEKNFDEENNRDVKTLIDRIGLCSQ